LLAPFGIAEIPPGALTKDGLVSITRLDALPPEAGDLGGLSYKAYEINAPTHTLEVSATITFSYQDLPMDDALAPDAVFAAYWDGETWQAIEGTVNATQRTLSIATGHFSDYSVFSLPSVSELVDRVGSHLASCMSPIKNPTKQVKDEDMITHLRDVVRWISTKMSVEPYVVNQVTNLGPFAARIAERDIQVDVDWFESVASWLPQDKRKLLSTAIVGHEFSHLSHNSSIADMFDVWRKLYENSEPNNLALRRELESDAADLLLSMLGLCGTFQSRLAQLWTTVKIAPLCIFFNTEELISDRDGIKWAAEYGIVKKWSTKTEVGLIYATFFERLARPSYCSHPSSQLRAQQVVSILGLGPDGGVYGKMTPAGAQISIDGQVLGEADTNGQFLITGIAPGKHNVLISKAGFETQTLSSFEVPRQRLKDMTKESPIVLRPISLTPTATPTARAIPVRTATPGLTPITVRTATPGLITDFETWGTWRRGDQAWGTFTQSQEQVSGGSYSGKFTYNFPAVADNFLVYRQTIAIAGQPAALKIMVYGDGSGNYLNAWVQDANGQIWQFTFGQIWHTGWQQMSAMLDVSRGWPNEAIGGNPTTAAPVYPLRFSGLVLDGHRGDIPLQGVVYVDDLLVGAADGLTPIPVITSTPTAGPTAGADIVFRADRTSISAGECATLRWDVDNVTAVYLDGQGVGGHESRQVCPTATQTYNLTVSRQDGSQQQASVTIQVAGGGVTPTSAPTTIPPAGPCEAVPGESYDAINIQGSPSDRPAESHADLNLALRGYEGTSAALQFSDYGPAVDPNGPQLPGLFGDQRTPGFTSAYQVFDWDWGCNCRAGLLNRWDTTLLGMAVSPGETIRVPDSGRSIGSGYEVLVLYATPDRITLKYTPEDNAVSGYTIHIEDVCVEPNLLGLYQSLNQAGRGRLPALRAGQAFGRAKGGEIKVAVRDGGAFFDPRSRQDWWRGR
jgi:hypothetical protein